MSEDVTSAPDEGAPKPPPKATRPRAKATRPRREPSSTPRKAPDDPDVRVGAKIAGYLLEEQIGQGGMAIVYRARDERLDRMVALKLLAPGIAADAAFRQRFIRESRAAAAVDHPNIIPVYDAGDSGQALFIAMRYVQGGDVKSLLARQGPLPPARVWSIITQVASALDAAHTHGLVHRDVKPANILLDQSAGVTGDHKDQDLPEHVYLSDFGISKQDVSSQLTSTGQFVGTLDYIAPEQIEGPAVNGLTDLYSLGCAAFELLSGTPPFQREQAMGLIAAHLSEPPPALSSRRAGLPAATDRVLIKAMAKSPADRYPTCSQFAADLGRALGLLAGVVQALAPGLPGAAGQGTGDLAKRWPATELAGQASGPEVRPDQNVDPATMNAPRPSIPGVAGPIAAGAGGYIAGPSGQQQYPAGQFGQGQQGQQGQQQYPQPSGQQGWTGQPGQQQAQQGWPGQQGQQQPQQGWPGQQGQQQAQQGWPGQQQQQYAQPSGQQGWPGQYGQQPGTGPGQYGQGPYPPAQYTQPQVPAGPKKSRGPLIGVAVAIVALAVAGGVFVLKSKAGPGPTSSGTPSASATINPTTTPTPTPTTPTPAPTTANGGAQSQADATNSLLVNSANSRTTLTHALAVANDCSGPSYAVRQLQRATNQRQTELNQADGLSTDALQNGAALKSDLMQALQYSLSADNSYLSWAEQQQASCVAGSEPDPAANSLATDYKQMFLNIWTGIASQYGLQQFNQAQI